MLCEIAGNQLLYINVTQYSVLLACLYGCVAEERCKPAESLPVLRKWLWHETVRKNISFKDQLFWFLEHTQYFEVAVSGATKVEGLQSPTPSHLENVTAEYKCLNVF